MSKEIYTIGHSTRPIETFIDLLKAYEIDLVLDVRTIPKSRHNPRKKTAKAHELTPFLHVKNKQLIYS